MVDGPGRGAAVFLDKDGTLVEDVPNSVDLARLRLAPGAAEGLRLLHGAGYRLLVVTNQPGVARGLFTEAQLLRAGRRLGRLAAACGAPLTGFYYCPHEAGAGCACRKPSPGLIERAAGEHRLDPRRSWMVGDILDDIEAGRRARCRTVLIDNGHETEWRLTRLRRPHLRAPDVGAAARLILGRRGGS